MTIHECAAILLSKTCAGCGCGKAAKAALCLPCYRKLPVSMQNDLYERFGSGFETAYPAALAWLRDNQPKPKTGKAQGSFGSSEYPD